MIEKMNEALNSIDNFVMSDDVGFHINGYVNKRYWTADKLRSLHSQRVTVWCAILGVTFMKITFRW